MKEETYVWFVLGDKEFGEQPVLFDTKLGAEKWARALFPEEDEDKRYSRVRARRVWTMDEI